MDETLEVTWGQLPGFPDSCQRSAGTGSSLSAWPERSLQHGSVWVPPVSLGEPYPSSNGLVQWVRCPHVAPASPMAWAVLLGAQGGPESQGQCLEEGPCPVAAW